MARLRHLLEVVIGLAILLDASLFLLNLLNDKLLIDYENPEHSFRKLSDEFQATLLKWQDSSSSSKVLNCGLKFQCGMGCQIHHRVTCIMLAHALQIPFVHYAPMWSYTDPWDRFLEPVALNNTVNDSTVSWEEDVSENEPIKKLLGQGIPVPKHMAKMLNDAFSSEMEAIYWIVGQYVKFSFQLNSVGKEMISRWRKKLILSSGERLKNPLFGIHVRNTDKWIEAPVLRVNEDYMEAARVYREKLLKNNVTFDHINVFIASDDHTVLPYFQKKFASIDWNFIGFPDNHTFRTQGERSSQLAQIIRDIIFLSECDFVICTHTSNICRLVLEIKMYQKFETDQKAPEPKNLVMSLDDDYLYEAYFPGPLRAPLKLIFI